ncbi:MAG: lytic transglycosylase domain-containing protein [Gammaproteobacteria bacterium]
MRKALLLLMAGLINCCPAHAEFYNYVRADGLVKYTSVPRKKGDKPRHYHYVNYPIPEPGARNVYRYVAKNGRVYYSTQRKKGYAFYGRRRPVNYAKFLPYLKINRSKYSRLITKTARKHHLDPDLLHAVIRVESAYNPRAVSTAGAVGLMQLMPDTAERYGVSDRNDPAQNVEGGARYLRDLLAMFDANLTLAIAAYNAGENAVLKYNRSIPPYPETRQYVKQVLALYQRS